MAEVYPLITELLAYLNDTAATFRRTRHDSQLSNHHTTFFYVRSLSLQILVGHIQFKNNNIHSQPTVVDIDYS